MKEIEQSSPMQNASIENPGRFVCNQLKSIRRHIAKENGIRLEIPKCKFKGECDGTCPRCDAELQYLEQALSWRSAMGKAAIVSGMVVGLMAGSLTATAQSVTPELKDNHHILSEHQSSSDTCIFKGCVKDSATMDPLPSANVLLKKKDGSIVAGTKTDWEGNFTFKVPKGKYILVVNYIGYHTQEYPIKLKDDNLTIGMIALPNRALMGLVVTRKVVPRIEMGSTESGERIDSDRINHMPTP